MDSFGKKGNYNLAPGRYSVTLRQMQWNRYEHRRPCWIVDVNGQGGVFAKANEPEHSATDLIPQVALRKTVWCMNHHVTSRNRPRNLAPGRELRLQSCD